MLRCFNPKLFPQTFTFSTAAKELCCCPHSVSLEGGTEKNTKSAEILCNLCVTASGVERSMFC